MHTFLIKIRSAQVFLLTSEPQFLSVNVLVMFEELSNKIRKDQSKIENLRRNPKIGLLAEKLKFKKATRRTKHSNGKPHLQATKWKTPESARSLSYTPKKKIL